MKFLTGLCQDDVTTSRGDVISRKKLHSCAGDNFGKSRRRNFGNLLWFRNYAAKSRPGGKFTPSLGFMCVNIKIKITKTFSYIAIMYLNWDLHNGRTFGPKCPMVSKCWAGHVPESNKDRRPWSRSMIPSLHSLYSFLWCTPIKVARSVRSFFYRFCYRLDKSIKIAGLFLWDVYIIFFLLLQNLNPYFQNGGQKTKMAAKNRETNITGLIIDLQSRVICQNVRCLNMYLI